jgi:putative tryptophan/tyrosine transport system substrate-binding protein
MKRREFFGVVGGLAVMSVGVRAQQGERVRRVGLLMNLAADDPEGAIRIAAFAQSLQELRWVIGRNLQIDTRWAAGDPERFRRHAAELLAGNPDVILATGTSAVAPLRQATRDLPIVFVNIVDPVGAGLVESLARPGGNVTGFLLFEYGMGAKWLELLKEVAPALTRAVVLRDPGTAPGIGQFAGIQAVAPSVGVELRPADVRDTGEIERSMGALGGSSNVGIIVPASPSAAVHRDLIIKLAAQHRLPSIYNSRIFTASGGLMSYGPNSVDPYRRAATYVDRILKGEKPADLPVQAPTRYELVINLKTAKSFGLPISSALLARADEVIE